MSVDSTHPDYDKLSQEWRLVSASVSGSREIKKLRTNVLPKPEDYSSEDGLPNDRRYRSYLERAVYTNFTGRTKNGLLGAAFRQGPKIDMPQGLDYLIDDADGTGQSIEQLSKDILGSLFSSGREPLLVDYPNVPDGLSREEEASINPKAHIIRYGADSLINWKTQNVSGVQMLILAVLRESRDISSDEFAVNSESQFRVLRLSGGVYTQQLYTLDAKTGKYAGGEVFMPRQAGGSPFNFIPLFVVGAQNNDISVDDIPLADIANLNVGHFRNSADLEENCFIHGQLTLGVTSDLAPEQWEIQNPNGVRVGAPVGHYLGTNGGFTSVQAQPNQLADKLMERKETQMRAIGAKMIEQRGGNQTAEAARIDAGGESSVLSDLVGNVEEAIQRCIEWAGLFMGVEVSNSKDVFSMNRSFFEEGVDPQMVMAAIQLSDRAVIGKTDLMDVARKAKFIRDSRTDEEVRAETDTLNPLE